MSGLCRRVRFWAKIAGADKRGCRRAGGRGCAVCAVRRGACHYGHACGAARRAKRAARARQRNFSRASVGRRNGGRPVHGGQFSSAFFFSRFFLFFCFLSADIWLAGGLTGAAAAAAGQQRRHGPDGRGCGAAAAGPGRRRPGRDAHRSAAGVQTSSKSNDGKR